jgi:hypothetical protein
MQINFIFLQELSFLVGSGLRVDSSSIALGWGWECVCNITHSFTINLSG